MAQSYRSNNANRVFLGFVLSCAALLIASCVLTIWSAVSLSPYRGVPVKNYIAQSDEFTICAAALIGLAIERLRVRDWAYAIALFVVACAFLSDIFFVTTSSNDAGHYCRAVSCFWPSASPLERVFRCRGGGLGVYWRLMGVVPLSP